MDSVAQFANDKPALSRRIDGGKGSRLIRAKDSGKFCSRTHHMAFEYDSFDDLMSSFARLKQLGIEPIVCVQHGVTTSLYYSDPDQNAVELQADNFGNWDKSAEWMSTSEAFRQNPIGAFFDPDPVLAAYQAGATFEQLQKDTWAGKYPPSKPLNLHLPPLD